jgi:hypothetical protein
MLKANGRGVQIDVYSIRDESERVREGVGGEERSRG